MTPFTWAHRSRRTSGRNRRRHAAAPGEHWAFEDAIVFSGGGNAGAAEVGMARVLLEAGIEPDLLLGCSVGALNAAYLACDPSLAQVDRMEAIWRRIGPSNVFAGSKRTMATNLVRRSDHLFEPYGLHALIETSMPVRDLADTKVPVQIVTTDISTSSEAWWSAGDPVDVLMASACLPGIFPPVRLGDSLHVDGGVLCPVPVERAVELGARRVWVLDVSAQRAPALGDHPSALDVLLTSFAAARHALRDHDADGAEAAAQPGQSIVMIRPDLPAGLDVRDFSRTAELIDLGAEAARAALNDLKATTLAG